MTSHAARRVVGVACMVAAGLGLAACGSDQATNSPGGSGGTGSAPISTRDLPEVGTVLVDSSGKTLYFADEEKADDIRCTDQCLSMWQPMIVTSEPGDAGVNDLSLVKRPEGTSQLAYQNRPLYTFSLDTADKPASGHNATDSFAGIEFTWHAAVVSIGSQQPPPNTGGGYGNGGGY